MPRHLAISLVFVLAGMARAGVIRGDVVEKATGYSLARATVVLIPLSGNANQRPQQTDARGLFEFRDLPAGSYLLKASRAGFLPAEFGQRAWNSAGTSITLTQSDVFTARLALPRFGGITGTVRDANEVGIPDQDVAVYTNTRPPRLITKTKTDDRGIYRAGSLEPGAYLVRSAGGTDGSFTYVPTFSSQTQRVDDARPVTVYADSDTRDGDIRPIQGTLFHVLGFVSSGARVATGVPAVTLASDVGREVVNSAAFRFDLLPPGQYELYAETTSDQGLLGAYTRFELTRDMPNVELQMGLFNGNLANFQGLAADATVSLQVRRKDLAGAGPSRTLQVKNHTPVPLGPGRWEILASPPEGHYAVPDGWHEITITSPFQNRLTIAFEAGGGIVSGTAPASAPVFLERWDPSTRKRLVDLRQTRASSSGTYSFTNLPPGQYRVMSTSESNAPDEAFFDQVSAKAVSVSKGGATQVDLSAH